MICTIIFSIPAWAMAAMAAIVRHPGGSFFFFRVAGILSTNLKQHFIIFWPETASKSVVQWVVPWSTQFKYHSTTMKPPLPFSTTHPHYFFPSESIILGFSQFLSIEVYTTKATKARSWAILVQIPQRFLWLETHCSGCDFLFHPSESWAQVPPVLPVLLPRTCGGFPKPACRSGCLGSLIRCHVGISIFAVVKAG